MPSHSISSTQAPRAPLHREGALAGKVAIVTGATSGIGYATAKLFASEGASVVLAGRRAAELHRLVGEIEAGNANATASVVAVAGDVRDESHAETLVGTAVAKFGGLDIAFFNAGAMGAVGDTASVGLAQWNDTIATNLTSAFLGAKYALPAMTARGGGSIVLTSSFVGSTASFPGMAAYAASKAGLVGLAQALAVEFGPRAVRVNAILPGATDTPSGPAATNPPDVVAYIKGLHALRRLASPDEIARSVLYLASDASSFTTGAALLVDGGVSVNRG